MCQRYVMGDTSRSFYLVLYVLIALYVIASFYHIGIVGASLIAILTVTQLPLNLLWLRASS